MREVCEAFRGNPLSSLWRGHGTAVFLEFGRLTRSEERRKDGSLRYPKGELSVMVEGAWRIEGKRSIICGSGFDERVWERGFSMLRGKVVVDFVAIGRLPEIQIQFSNGACLTSFADDRGQPGWTIFDNRQEPYRTFLCRLGRFEEE